MKLGNIDLSKIYLGNNNVNKIYLGNDLVFHSDIIDGRYLKLDYIEYFVDGDSDTATITFNEKQNIISKAELEYMYISNPRSVANVFFIGYFNGWDGIIGVDTRTNTFITSTSGTDVAISPSSITPSVKTSVTISRDGEWGLSYVPMRIGNMSYWQSGNHRYYRVKLYNRSNVLINDSVPVYDTQTQKSGMFDLVNKVFYTNTGTGHFRGVYRGYTIKEYIRSIDASYIDTGVKAIGGFRITMNLAMTSITSANGLFGLNGDNKESFVRISNATSGIAWSNTRSVALSNLSLSTDTRFDVDCTFDSTTTITIDNQTFTITTTNNYFDKNIPLLCIDYNNSISNFTSAKLYSCVMYDLSNKKTRHFIPMLSSNDVAGMYDIINKVFYTNAGSGSFIAGGDV